MTGPKQILANCVTFLVFKIVAEKTKRQKPRRFVVERRRRKKSYLSIVGRKPYIAGMKWQFKEDHTFGKIVLIFICLL